MCLLLGGKHFAQGPLVLFFCAMIVKSAEDFSPPQTLYSSCYSPPDHRDPRQPHSQDVSVSAANFPIFGLDACLVNQKLYLIRCISTVFSTCCSVLDNELTCLLLALEKMEEIGSKEHLILAPRPTISLSTLKTQVSDIDDVSSARGAELDEIRLTEQLHHRLLCLPPVDTGKDAYLFLLACFVLSALVWSKSYSPPHVFCPNLKNMHG